MDGEEGVEVIPEFLDLFSSIPTQVAVKSGKYKRIDPIASLDNSGAINFAIKCDDTEFFDLSRSLICVVTRITDGDGADLPDEEVVGGVRGHNAASDVILINGIGSTWFKNLQVKINGTSIESSDGMYAFRADLDNRLSYSRDAKDHQLTMEGFDEELYPFEDVVAGNMRFGEDPYAGANSKAVAFVRRYNRTKNGKRLHTYARIHAGIFEQEKPLPPGTKLELIFERNEQNFVLLTKRDEAFKAIIDECYIFARTISIDDQIYREMSDEIFNNKRNIEYHFRRVRMFSHAKGGGNRDISITDLCPGEPNLPRRVFIGLLRQDAVHGSKRHDPFNYQHFNLSSVKFDVGGEVRPYPEMKMHFNQDEYCEGLFSLLEATGAMLTDHDIGITYENYHSRNVLFGANFTGCSNQSGEAFELPEQKQINLSLRLEGLGLGGIAILVMVYAEYDATVSITPQKSVEVSLNG